MEKYNLRELQLVELEILKEFIQVCNKMNLKYFLVGGTLIGAIRHKGFIPWDDDIDVCMPRNDYEEFINNGQKYIKNTYFIQTYKTDSEYIQNFAKIRNSETTFIESSCKNRKMNHGVYIDIFPLDGYPTNKVLQHKMNFLNKLYNIQTNKFFSIEKKRNKSIKSRIVNYISNLLSKNKSLKEIQNKKEKLYTKYNLDDCEMCTLYGGAYGKKEVSYKKYFGSGIEKEFEGITVRVPEQYDLYLKGVYGDYMKLPPEEKRVIHHYSEVIDLNNSYKKYCK